MAKPSDAPMNGAAGHHLAELKQTGQVQTQQGEQHRQCRDHGRGLQLKAPAQLLAGTAQRQQGRPQQDQRQHHTGGVGQARSAVLGAALAWLGKAQHLDGQHREYTRHEVEQQTTDEGAQQSQSQTACAAGRRGLGVVLQRFGQRWRHGRRRRQSGPCALDGAGHFQSRCLGRGLRALGDDPRQSAGAFAALVRDGHLRCPPIALPVLRPGFALHGRVVHHMGGDGEQAQGLATPSGGQLVNLERQAAAIGREADRVCAWKGLGGLLMGGVKQAAVQGRGALHRQAQLKLAFLRDALLTADQPLGLQLDFHRTHQGHFEIGAYCDGHWQQHRAFVAVVGQGSDGNFLGQRPGDLAHLQARRQFPLQACGQARVAGVLPVSVPMRLVLDLQAQPEALPGLNALRRMGQ